MTAWAIRFERFSMIVEDGVVKQINVETEGGKGHCHRRRDHARASLNRRAV